MRLCRSWHELRRGWLTPSLLPRHPRSYIFLLPPSSLAQPPKTTPKFTALLHPHKVDDMWPGLPRKGVSGSDHVAVAAEIQL